MEEPEMPEFKDFRAGTSIYTELNMAERKEYNTAYRIFKGQMKLFQREEDQIRKARERI